MRCTVSDPFDENSRPHSHGNTWSATRIVLLCVFLAFRFGRFDKSLLVPSDAISLSVKRSSEMFKSEEKKGAYDLDQIIQILEGNMNHLKKSIDMFEREKKCTKKKN